MVNAIVYALPASPRDPRIYDVPSNPTLQRLNVPCMPKYRVPFSTNVCKDVEMRATYGPIQFEPKKKRRIQEDPVLVHDSKWKFIAAHTCLHKRHARLLQMTERIIHLFVFQNRKGPSEIFSNHIPIYGERRRCCTGMGPKTKSMRMVRPQHHTNEAQNPFWLQCLVLHFLFHLIRCLPG